MYERKRLNRKQLRRLRHELGRDDAHRVGLRREITCTECGTRLGEWLIRPATELLPARHALRLHGRVIPTGRGKVDGVLTRTLDQRPGRWVPVEPDPDEGRVIAHGKPDGMQHSYHPAVRVPREGEVPDPEFVPEEEFSPAPIFTLGGTLRCLGSDNNPETARRSLTEASAASEGHVLVRVICPRCDAPNLLDSRSLQVGGGD